MFSFPSLFCKSGGWSQPPCSFVFRFCLIFCIFLSLILKVLIPFLSLPHPQPPLLLFLSSFAPSPLFVLNLQSQGDVGFVGGPVEPRQIAISGSMPVMLSACFAGPLLLASILIVNAKQATLPFEKVLRHALHPGAVGVPYILVRPQTTLFGLLVANFRSIECAADPRKGELPKDLRLRWSFC